MQNIVICSRRCPVNTLFMLIHPVLQMGPPIIVGFIKFRLSEKHTKFKKYSSWFWQSADLLSKRQNHEKAFANYVCFSKSWKKYPRYHKIWNQTCAENFSCLSWQTKKDLFIKQAWKGFRPISTRWGFYGIFWKFLVFFRFFFGNKIKSNKNFKFSELKQF